VLAGFQEDKDMILAQQRILDLDPEAPMLALRMDTALASFRALLEKAIAGEREYTAGSGSAAAPAAGSEASSETAAVPAH
jgi:hypothetical protein